MSADRRFYITHPTRGNLLWRADGQPHHFGDAEPLRPAGAPDNCAVCEREGRACHYCATVAFAAKLSARAEPLFTAPQTMRGQLAMPTDTVQR